MAWKSSGRPKGLDQAEDESAREPLNSSSRCVAGLESATRDHTPLPRGQENPGGGRELRLPRGRPVSASWAAALARRHEIPPGLSFAAHAVG
jgi:hypothetical protein